MSSFRSAALLHIEDIPLPAVIGSFRVMRECNQAYCELFGYEQSQLAGKSFRLIYLNNSEYVRSGILWEKNLSKNHQYTDERIMRKSNGETQWCRVTGKTLDERNPTALAIWLVQPLSRPVMMNVSELTRKQRQLISLVTQGKTSRQIAAELGITIRAAETHRLRIMKKVGVKNAAEMVAWFAGLHDPAIERE